LEKLRKDCESCCTTETPGKRKTIAILEPDLNVGHRGFLYMLGRLLKQRYELVGFAMLDGDDEGPGQSFEDSEGSLGPAKGSGGPNHFYCLTAGLLARETTHSGLMNTDLGKEWGHRHKKFSMRVLHHLLITEVVRQTNRRFNDPDCPNFDNIEIYSSDAHIVITETVEPGKRELLESKLIPRLKH
jgi:hypothetical protein